MTSYCDCLEYYFYYLDENLSQQKEVVTSKESLSKIVSKTWEDLIDKSYISDKGVDYIVNTVYDANKNSSENMDKLRVILRGILEDFEITDQNFYSPSFVYNGVKFVKKGYKHECKHFPFFQDISECESNSS